MTLPRRHTSATLRKIDIVLVEPGIAQRCRLCVHLVRQHVPTLAFLMIFNPSP